MLVMNADLRYHTRHYPNHSQMWYNHNLFHFPRRYHSHNGYKHAFLLLGLPAEDFCERARPQ